MNRFIIFCHVVVSIVMAVGYMIWALILFAVFGVFMYFIWGVFALN